MAKKPVKNAEYYRPIVRLVMEVRQRRLEKGLKQEDLADMLGTKQPSVSRFERVGRIPSYDFLINLCEALDSKLFMSINGEYAVVVPEELRQRIDDLANWYEESRETLLMDILIDAIERQYTNSPLFVRAGANTNLIGSYERTPSQSNTASISIVMNKGRSNYRIPIVMEGMQQSCKQSQTSEIAFAESKER